MECGDTFFGHYFLKPMCPIFRGLLKKLLKLKVNGMERLNLSGNFIVASNHRSHLDPPVLNTVFPQPLVFLAKEELFKPPLGLLIKHMRIVGVRRGSGDKASLEVCLELLRRGCWIGIFPEGTRAEPGTFLKPKSGVGLLAVRSGVPVLPVFIEGTDRILPRGKTIPRLGHRVTVSIGTPRSYGDYPDNLKGYRLAASHIMNSIIELSSRNPS